jgi:hypothetical protein
MLLVHLLLWMLGVCAVVAPFLLLLAVLWGTVRVKAHVVQRVRRSRELAVERQRAEGLIRELKRDAIRQLLNHQLSPRTVEHANLAEVQVAKMAAAARIEAGVADDASRETQ